MAISRHRLKAFAAALVIFSGLLIAISKQLSQELTTFPPWLQWYAKWIFDRAVLIYLFLMLLAAILRLWASIRTEKDRRKALSRVLDALLAEVMTTPDTYNAQDHRVTLFVHRRWSWAGWREHRKRICQITPWSGWLTPIARSSDLPSSSTFHAPRICPQGQTQGHGICGTAWLLGRADASGLPDLRGKFNPNDVGLYALSAHMCQDEVQQRVDKNRSVARALYAERVTPKGKPHWGVVIYDSVDPRPIIDERNRAGHRVGLQSLALVIEEYAA
jgi:hypothetical protein